MGFIQRLLSSQANLLFDSCSVVIAVAIIGQSMEWRYEIVLKIAERVQNPVFAVQTTLTWTE